MKRFCKTSTFEWKMNIGITVTTTKPWLSVELVELMSRLELPTRDKDRGRETKGVLRNTK